MPTHFELLECSIQSNNHKFRLFVIYRPPPSKSNQLKTSTFFEEWLDFLDYTVNISEEIIITGDLNFHIDDINNPDGRRFLETIYDRGLEQHVAGATHAHGHTLDVVISRENSRIIEGIPSVDETPIGDTKSSTKLDHFAIVCKLNLVKPPRQRKSLTIRRYKEINIDNFQTDINSSCLLHERNASLDCEVDKYDSVLRNLIDKHAPVQTKLVTLHPNTEWYSDELRASNYI